MHRIGLQITRTGITSYITTTSTEGSSFRGCIIDTIGTLGATIFKGMVQSQPCSTSYSIIFAFGRIESHTILRTHHPCVVCISLVNDQTQSLMIVFHHDMMRNESDKKDSGIIHNC